ncbi:uncharacterized protein LOC143294354 [Babylonia areolata]|uniref:uncharacterized protein LOC143294354 n=1 Tax=Babylonia areolata TaxID=304850 RepID=UPI003FD224CF
MKQRQKDDVVSWLCCCVCSLAGTVFQVADGSCGQSSGSSSSQRRQTYQEDKCWYELWYFWFIVALVFLTVAILVLFFCKQQVKRSAGRQGRRCTPVLTMPMAPPEYELPGHQPPPYHIAISSPPLPCFPPPGPHCPALQPYVLPPGYVGGQEQEPELFETMSVTSVGALSNPPPYSPPRSAYRSSLHGDLQNPQ